MSWYHYVIGAVLLVVAVIITVVVLMQQGRSEHLSGSIGGGSDAYEGTISGRSN